MKEIRIGDHIRFRAACRWSDRAVVRKVSGFHCGQPTVRFGGYKDFVVRLDEISDVTNAPR